MSLPNTASSVQYGSDGPKDTPSTSSPPPVIYDVINEKVTLTGNPPPTKSVGKEVIYQVLEDPHQLQEGGHPEEWWGGEEVGDYEVLKEGQTYEVPISNTRPAAGV